MNGLPVSAPAAESQIRETHLASPKAEPISAVHLQEVNPNTQGSLKP